MEDGCPRFGARTSTASVVRVAAFTACISALVACATGWRVAPPTEGPRTVRTAVAQADEPGPRQAVGDPPAVPPVVRGALGERMDAFVRRAAAFGFNGQVLVEKGGEVILHRAYGFADRGSGRAMTVETPIGIASMSKQLVAAAILGDGPVALIEGAAAPDPAAIRASGRTEALLRGLEAGAGEAAFRRALGDDGAPHLPDYWAEWQGVEARHGALREFELLGSRPLRGGAWATHASLRLDERDVPMTFIWSDDARGRLSGTFVRDAPNMEPLPGSVVVRAEGSGCCLAHDVFRGTTIRFRREGGTLVFELGDPGREVRAEPVPRARGASG